MAQRTFPYEILAASKSNFLSNTTYSQRNCVKAVGRNQLKLQQRLHLKSNQPAISQLWQLSTSLFSLTSSQELSNEAFLTSTSLLLGLLVPNDRYLQATQPLYANTDIWADSLLNKSAHVAETAKQPTPNWPTSVEILPHATSPVLRDSLQEYRDEGQNHQSRKRADMKTLTGCGIPPNPQLNLQTSTKLPQLNLQSSTKLVMDFTIGHTST
jgi:hypothetical protein